MKAWSGRPTSADEEPLGVVGVAGRWISFGAGRPIAVAVEVLVRPGSALHDPGERLRPVVIGVDLERDEDRAAPVVTGERLADEDLKTAAALESAKDKAGVQHRTRPTD